MPDKKILVPVDFTELSDMVIKQAALLSTISDSVMVLLHIADKSANLTSLTAALTRKAIAASKKYNVTCDSIIRQGSLFKEVHNETEENDYLMAVIGTHGVRGLKQKLLGSHILKVITKIPVPVLVVQSTSPYRTSFERIILPVATHQSYDNILNGVVLIAKLFGSEVHIYSIERPGFEWPDSIKKNIDKTRAIFNEHGIKHVRVNEKQTVLSIGFANQTLKYAEKSGADMIAIMSVSSEEYHYFAQQDKENLLTNEGGLPVLCASNLIKEEED